MLSRVLDKDYDVESKIYKRINGYGNVYFKLAIYKKKSVQRLRDGGLFNKEQMAVLKLTI